MFFSLLAIISIFGYLEGKPIIARNISDCSITEDGILHYQGKHSFSKFEHECLPWIDFQIIHSDIVNEVNFFADSSIYAAMNYCRNPTMNKNGPWCFVQNEDTITIEECDLCQSLSFRPTSTTDIEKDENVIADSTSANVFQFVKDEIRRYGIYIRQKILQIIDRMRQKFRQFGAKLF